MSNVEEILKYLSENDKINLSHVREQIEMKKREEILHKHKNEVWRGKDGYWRTYLPTLDGKRKLVKKKKKEDLDEVVIEYWGSTVGNTFKERYDVWIERQSACGRSDNTIYRYETDYKRFFKGDPFANLDIRNITEEHISEFILRLLQRKDIPWRALQSMFGYINGVFEKSVKDKVIAKNPCVYVDLPIFRKHCKDPKPKTKEERTLSAKERKMLAEKMESDETITRDAVLLSLYTGMRVGELSGLMWEDIDEKSGIMTIQRSEKHNQKTDEFYVEGTKNDKVRYIPITCKINWVLNRIKAYHEEHGTFGEYVFMDENGRIHARNISNCARRHTMNEEYSGVKSIHAIRRTLNSNMRCAGVPSPIAASMMGHTERVNEANYTYDITEVEERRKIMQSATAS